MDDSGLLSKSSGSSKHGRSSNSPTFETRPLLCESPLPPAPKQGQSTQVVPKLGGQKERVWMTALFVTISSLPALLVGCTLGFPSIALLDLRELETRDDYKFNTILSDVFGVSRIK